MRLLTRYLFGLCLFFIINVPILAQPDVIELGAVLESNLGDGEAKQYQWLVLEATIVSIRAEALTSSVDPIIRLIDSTGNVVISNDDYDYPTSKDALIQSFAVTRTDTYIVEVSALGGTSGNIRLSLLPGYDVLAQQDMVINPSDWRASSQIIRTTSSNDRLFMEIEGIAESGYLIAESFSEQLDFFYQATFREITASTNWQVGLVFRYVSPSLFYRLILNDQGFWRIERIDGEDIITVDDGNTHPAIVPGVPEFTLGILTSGASLNVVYNGQLIGTVNDNAILQAGRMGVVVVTANAFNSRVTAMFDEALVTIPTKVNGKPVFPSILTGANYTATVNILERQQVVPVNGEAKYTSGQNVVQNIEPGVSGFPLVSGVEFDQFVMGVTVTMSSLTEGVGGCGMTFDAVDENNYTLAYINMAGEYGVSRRDGASFESGIFGDGLQLANSNTLMVIVLENILYLYIDDQYVGTMPYEGTMGEIGTAVVNFDSVDTTCTFEDLWLWSFDNLSQ